jgi:sugar O-acyltransferase (sialic acid O-acetyltransferase NeuD family)
MDVVVYGASGFGQQVMFWVEDAATEESWNVLGFLDDDDTVLGSERAGYEVLGGRQWLEAREGARPGVVVGIADPAVKSRIAESLEPLGIGFPTVVHPSVVRARDNRFADGCVVGAGNVISVNVELGELVTVNHSCTIAHDARIGDYATILPGSNLSGRVAIEPRVTVGTNAAIVQDVPPGVTAVGTPARPI